MTRKEKREILAERNFFGEFLIIKNHFFKELFVRLKKVRDGYSFFSNLLLALLYALINLLISVFFQLHGSSVVL